MTSFRLVAFSVVIMCLIACGYSQVTFSKGWGPGKRTSDIYDERQMNPKYTALECHASLYELQKLITLCGKTFARYLRLENDFTQH